MNLVCGSISQLRRDGNMQNQENPRSYYAKFPLDFGDFLAFLHNPELCQGNYQNNRHQQGRSVKACVYCLTGKAAGAQRTEAAGAASIVMGDLICPSQNQNRCLSTFPEGLYSQCALRVALVISHRTSLLLSSPAEWQAQLRHLGCRCALK